MPDKEPIVMRTSDSRQWVLSENEERSLGDLVSGVTNDLATLMRQEIQLARAETMEKVTETTQSAIWMAAGGMVAYAGVIALLIAAIVGLANFIPLWLSAAIVGLVVIVVGYLLIQSGRSRLSNVSVVPEKTIASIQEDAALVKEKVS
jgi:hypothetical protein